MSALAAEVLGRWALAPLHWSVDGKALDLHRDLTRLLELRLRLEVGEMMEHGLEGEAAVLRVFQASSGALERNAGDIVASLARRVRQVLTEWR